jgi:SAM-dependent methyltransferase
MKFFERDDGTPIEIIPGFRERTLNYRRAISPRAEWSDTQYAEAAVKKRKRFQRIADKAKTFLPSLTGISVLDVGCGDASNCVLFAEAGAACVTGIDLDVALFAQTDKGERARRLVSGLLNVPQNTLEAALAERNVSLQRMDATRMSFADASFDVVMSRSAMEHVRPAEEALREIARVTRPGGLIYLSIDPFYWLRGCHKRGVVDIPWAHARLTLSEFSRFVSSSEGEAKAVQRTERLETLNRFTAAQWEERIRALNWTVLVWQEDPSPAGETALQSHPQVLSTLLPGVTERDLRCERIRVWIRR